MKKLQLSGVLLAIGLVVALLAGEAWAQYRENSPYLGNRGRPSTVLDLMRQERAISNPTVRNPPGAPQIRRPPGFFEESPDFDARRQIVSPGTEDVMLPGRDRPADPAEQEASGLAAETAPQFPTPKEAPAGAPPATDDGAVPAEDAPADTGPVTAPSE